MQHQLELIERTISKMAAASPHKSPCPNFLTKDSNMTGFAAWDVDGRVDTMESEFKALKDMVNTTMTQRRSEEDEFERAKNRGESNVGFA